MLSKIKELIVKSITDHLGKISSARIASYFILAQIMLSSLAIMVIDVINASILWNKGETFSMSTEHIIVFGMLLTHHLMLLGIKKATEASSFPSLDKKIEADSRKSVDEYVTEYESDDSELESESSDYNPDEEDK